MSQSGLVPSSAISRKFVLVVALATLLGPLAFSLVHAQGEDKAIRTVIDQLFRGMELGDSAMVRQCFANPTTMVTIKTDPSGNAEVVRVPSMDGFVKAVGSPRAEIWKEEIWNLKITVDGALAQAWCDYAFYVGNTFSHCGVDAFHLFKGPEGWRIFHIADTRKTSGCSIPKSVERRRQR